VLKKLFRTVSLKFKAISVLIIAAITRFKRVRKWHLFSDTNIIIIKGTKMGGRTKICRNSVKEKHQI